MTNTKSETKTITLTNPDKMFFPEQGLRKKDVFNYYEKIAETMLPYLKDRPVTLQRFPDGIQNEGFYEKRPMDYFPKRIETVTVPQKTHDEPITYMLINNKETLLYLVNQATIAFHRQLATSKHINKPTHLVFDLDPHPKTSIKQLKTGVRQLHRLLEKKNMQSELMTTGGKGFHILIDLKQQYSYKQVKEKATNLASELIDNSELFTRAAQKKDRKAPIYLDIQRNNYGQTAICPYSLRAKPGATVATLIERDELDQVTPDKYHLGNIFRRLGQKK